MSQANEPLPPGWEAKYDARTNKSYFINHYTKATTWEDPRVRYQQIGKPVSSAASTSSKENTRHGGTTSHELLISGSDGAPIQTKPLSYPIGTIPPSSSGTTFLPSSSQPSPASHSTTPSSHQMMVMLPLHGNTSASGTATSGGASAVSGAHLVSTDDVISMLQQQHILQDISNRRAGSPTTGGHRASSSTQPLFGAQSATTTTHMMLNNQSTASPLPVARLQLEETLNGGGGLSTCGGSPMSQRSQLLGASQSGRRESHNVLENISEVDSQTGSNISGGGMSKKDDGEFHKYEVNSAVAAISSMFPTVDESHIRDLLKKTNCQITSDLLQELRQLERKTSGGKTSATREASVKKKTPTPPRTVSPEASVDPYLKSVFPTVEEYLLLDILSNSDNNVQKAADRLVKMGYVKRDTPSAPRLHARKKEEERLAEKRTPLPKPPQLKSDKEKQELRRKMCNKYEKKYDIPERILFMALESVLYDEEQANHLIMSMIEDDLKRQKSKEAEKLKEKEKRKSPKPNRRALAESERTSRHSSPKHEPKGPEGHGKKGWSKDSADGIPKTSRGTSTQQERPYKSEVSGKAKGPNPSLRKGPNDDLLLTDYVCWNGPDHENRKGPNKTIAKGPNMSLRAGPGGIANGPNPTLRKGPSGRSNGPITNHSNLGMNHSSSVPRPQGLPALVTVM